jgi:hypothetical protein
MYTIEAEKCPKCYTNGINDKDPDFEAFEPKVVELTEEHKVPAPRAVPARNLGLTWTCTV